MNTRTIFAMSLRVGDEIVNDDETSSFVEQILVTGYGVNLIVVRKDGSASADTYCLMKATAVRIHEKPVRLADVCAGNYVIIPCLGGECAVQAEAHDGPHQGVIGDVGGNAHMRYITSTTFKATGPVDKMVNIDWHTK